MSRDLKVRLLEPYEVTETETTLTWSLKRSVPISTIKNNVTILLLVFAVVRLAQLPQLRVYNPLKLFSFFGSGGL